MSAMDGATKTEGRHTMGLPLQKALIESLSQLRVSSPYADKITSYIDELQKENVFIRKSDYGSIITMVVLMASESPGILDNAPHNETLKDLCRHCVQQFNLLVELRAKAAMIRKPLVKAVEESEDETVSQAKKAGK